MTESAISEDQVAAAKDQIGAQVKIWRAFLFANPAAAVAFANRPPAQGAGEAVFCRRDNGQVDTFLFF